jgi:hypothetical protein
MALITVFVFIMLTACSNEAMRNNFDPTGRVTEVQHGEIPSFVLELTNGSQVSELHFAERYRPLFLFFFAPS